MFGTGTAARHNRFAGLGLALLFTAAGACVSTGGQAGSPFSGVPGEGEDIELLVRNLNFHQVTVYTARGGSSVRRLGTVPGKGEATFTMRWHLPDIQLRVRELAGEEYLTETLPVTPGDLLELIIPIR